MPESPDTPQTNSPQNELTQLLYENAMQEANCHDLLASVKYQVGSVIAKILIPRFRPKQALLAPIRLWRVYRRWRVQQRQQSPSQALLRESNQGGHDRESIRAEMVLLLDKFGYDSLSALLDKRIQANPALAERYYEIAYAILKRDQPNLAIDYGLKALALKQTEQFARNLILLMQRQGEIRRPFALSQQYLHDEFTSLKQKLADNQQLLESGFVAKVDASLSYQAKPKSVLYCVHFSLPYRGTGYATRSQALLTAVNQTDWQAQAVTRLGYPYDIEACADAEVPTNSQVQVVAYAHFTNARSPYLKTPLNEYLQAYTEQLLRLCRTQRPAILHAASNFVNGLAANAVARQLQIPSIYEVRGLWELTRLAKQPEWQGSEDYQLKVKLETQAASEASHVLTITDELKQILIARGVAEEKITVLPNGVDCQSFTPRARCERLRQQLGLTHEWVIGYIGTISVYEGLSDLLRAVANLKAIYPGRIKCVIVGDGAEYTDLQIMTNDLGLADEVVLTGRVPFSEIHDYYTIMDMLVYPRRGHEVCEVVSPLKPFEAMAMAKPILVSSVKALSSFVIDGDTGLVFEKDNLDDLTTKIAGLIEDPVLRLRLSEQARQWVCQHRDWHALVEQLAAQYSRLVVHR